MVSQESQRGKLGKWSLRFLVSGACAFLVVASVTSAESIEPPIAAKKDSVSQVHGDKKNDPYAWLKDTRPKKDPKIIAYLDDENRFTDQMMADTKDLQDKIYSETLHRIQEDDQSYPYDEGDYVYYSITAQGKQYPQFFRKSKRLQASPELLIDLNLLAVGKTFVNLGAFRPSPDGQTLAFSSDFDGSRKYTVYFKKLAPDKRMQSVRDSIPSVADQIAWANDSKTLFYSKYDSSMRINRVFRHVLGTDSRNDKQVMCEQDEAYHLSLEKTRSGKYILIHSSSKNSTEVWYIDADNPNNPPHLIEGRRTNHRYYVDHHGQEFFIRTNDKSPLFEIVRTLVTSPASKNWHSFVQPSLDVAIADLDAFESFLVLTLKENGMTRMRIIQTKDFAKILGRDIRFPDQVYSVWVGDNFDYQSKFLRLNYESLGAPKSTFDYQIASGELILRKQVIAPGFNPELYETCRISAKAADGTQIPMSLIYKKGIKKDGKNPLLIYGYGSYGISMEPYFSPSRISLLDRGFIFVTAHIRGGGELGDPWYQEGKLLKKKNTFTDFVSCVEYLIQQGYTQPQKLAAEGRSAGGLLMGAVMNLRPDLFKVILAGVPFVDVLNTMLDPSIPLTTEEYEEWGNPNDKIYYDYMKSYAPYENVTEKSYPNILLTTGMNDLQVPYWEPAKFAAKLRAKKTDHNLLLLQTEMGLGHGGASGRYDSIRKRSFELAFILKVLGIKN